MSAVLRWMACAACGACLAACTSTPPVTMVSCSPGIITGPPSLRLGRGSQSFIPVQDGDTWTAANGPQNGSHLWLSVQTNGVGPLMRTVYRFEELDGGTIATSRGSATLCANPLSQQQAVGITAFLPAEDDTRDRLLCQGPFVLHVTGSDEAGAKVEARALVGGVEPDEDSFIPFRKRCDAGVSPEDAGL